MIHKANNHFSVKKKDKYSMGTLAYEISSLIGGLDDDAAKYISIASNKARFKEVIFEIWKEDSARKLILSHINAFYVRKDERPKTGPDKNKIHYICEIYSDDSLIRSELDTHKELISIGLKVRGVEFEDICIKPSRRGMKTKHPFTLDIS